MAEGSRLTMSQSVAMARRNRVGASSESKMSSS